MAKKSVAKLRQEGAQKFIKVIRAVKSPKTGAYTFKEEIVPEQLAQETLNKKS
ncbi:MAG: DUF4295 domain-containing protein [Bernardetiaceae bacterium]|nr:DUF4295 domain-containing protein [Bernardetiaceae bacterium]